MKASIRESGEMYLETILQLSTERDCVRSIDVANAAGYSRPSVSRAMGLLRSRGYIEISEAGHISLTDAGRRIAERIFERHKILTEMFVRMGVSPGTAAADACRVEHVISDETFEQIKKYLIKL